MAGRASDTFTDRGTATYSERQECHVKHSLFLCDLCNRSLPPHGHYIVRIEVFADPAMPEMTAEELEEADFQQAMLELMETMKGMTADELQDQVHRQFEFKLCRACQMRFLVNPLGK